MNGWKIAAIISVIINILFLLLSIWVVNLGYDIQEKDNNCSYNVCSMDEAVSYYYDEYTEVCSCFDNNYNEIKSEYLG